ncbi:alcohol dehydrogenase catalytic domain-containing protein [Spiroplasma eriocheiris]|uniref:Alcohol dehydrogenase n=1 Tax=Spiroplasma eriocheiris TaxID=315358 RepID=A0A0H3XHH9_9MOLU|nr:alcohol dehydrogenase catalytic domain-containing protein [Spiroplasma eriocheiris]AHF57274.1 Zn-dependent alcohol dehydrogenase [Spiroplasma eriocheiris CCTCC M 207170]AKM53735.1 alcohol dehydrogenase [Spiroplasma eriocheiris]
MKGLVFKDKGLIDWSEVPTPKIINDEDIIVKIEEFTFSHADYRPYLGMDDTVAKNTIMGHEGVGIVSAIGKKVTTLKVGDRVVISCITHCNQCKFCQQGLYANCLNAGFILGTKINGTHAEYVRVPYGESSVYKLPSEISTEQGLMLSDVLLTAYENVILKVDFNKINNVALIGDGPIALAILLFLNSYRKKVTVFGHHRAKLEVFKDNGAEQIINSKDNEFGDEQYDLVVECVGNDRDTFSLAQQLVGFNGTIISIGVFKKPVIFNLNELWYKNITIKTGILNNGATLEVINEILAKKLDPNVLVSQVYNKNEVMEAFNQFENKDYFKIVVKL